MKFVSVKNVKPIHTQNCMYVRTGEHGCSCGGDERYRKEQAAARARQPGEKHK